MKILLIGNKGRLQHFIKEFLLMHHEVIEMHSDDAFGQLIDCNENRMLFDWDAIVYVGGEVYITKKMVRNNFTLPYLLMELATSTYTHFIYLNSQIVYAESLFDNAHAQKDRYSVYLSSKVVALHELDTKSGNVSHIMVGSIDSERGSTTIEKITKIAKHLKFLPIIFVPRLCFSSANYSNIAHALAYCLKYKTRYVNCYETHTTLEIFNKVVKNQSTIYELNLDWLIEISRKTKLIKYKTYMHLKEKVLVRVAEKIGNETVL